MDDITRRIQLGRYTQERWGKPEYLTQQGIDLLEAQLGIEILPTITRHNGYQIGDAITFENLGIDEQGHIVHFAIPQKKKSYANFPLSYQGPELPTPKALQPISAVVITSNYNKALPTTQLTKLNV